MHIRSARAEDIEDIARLWHLGWHQAHAALVAPDLVRLRDPAEFMHRTQAHLPQTRIALDGDGTLAGFFMIEEDELYQFYVAAARRGDGTAKVLMDAAEAAFGMPRVWLACTVGNARAAAFYTKCGWHNCGAEPCVVETGAGPRTVEVWRFEKAL